MTVMTHTTAQPERSRRAATARPTVTLTGVQPTGDLHLGNYIGAIRPLADLAVDLSRDVYVFVADLHALNSRPDPTVLRERSRRLVAVLLACGLDRPNVHVYRQSRVPAVAGMAALLNNVTAKGLLNRAHAYKAAVAANVAPGRDPEHGVLREPRVLIAETTATLPGLDGRKMSKSYGNAISLMAESEDKRKQIRRIITDSTPPAQPKDPDTCTLVALLRAFADPGTVAALEERYRTGGIGYGEVKARLADAIDAHVAPMRNRYHGLLTDPDELDIRLAEGEQHA